MKPEEAKRVLSSLFIGTDPVTGKPLPETAVLQRADTLRAFQTAIASLDATIARQAAAAERPANASKPWTDEECDRLIAGFQAGTPLADLATTHGRSLRGIESRLIKLGHLDPQKRTTQARYVENYPDRPRD